MHRLPVHVGDEVPSTEPCLLGWAPLLHVLGMGHPTGAELTGLVTRKVHKFMCQTPSSSCTVILITPYDMLISPILQMKKQAQRGK